MDEPTTTHSIISPSSAYRWMQCTGSVELLFKHEIKESTSQYAQRGIRIHQWAAWLLLHPDKLEAYSDLLLTATCNDDVLGIEEASNYAQYFCSFFDTEDKYGIEESICFDDIYPGMKGSVDSYIIKKQRKEVHIFDLKTGYMNITAKGNSQLMLYAWGVINKHSNPQAVKTIYLHIVQTNSVRYNTNIHVISIEELVNFILAVKAITYQIQHNKFYYKEGEYCKYCPVAVHCDKVLSNIQGVISSMENQDIDSLPLDKLSELVYNYTKYEPIIEKCKELIKSKLIEEQEPNKYFTIQTKKAANQNWKKPDHIILFELCDKYPFFFELLSKPNEDVKSFFNIKLPPFSVLKRALYNRRDLDECDLNNILTYLEGLEKSDEEVERISILKRNPDNG